MASRLGRCRLRVFPFSMRDMTLVSVPDVCANCPIDNLRCSRSWQIVRPSRDGLLTFLSTAFSSLLLNALIRLSPFYRHPDDSILDLAGRAFTIDKASRYRLIISC